MQTAALTTKWSFSYVADDLVHRYLQLILSPGVCHFLLGTSRVELIKHADCETFAARQQRWTWPPRSHCGPPSVQTVCKGSRSARWGSAGPTWRPSGRGSGWGSAHLSPSHPPPLPPLLSVHRERGNVNSLWTLTPWVLAGWGCCLQLGHVYRGE